MPTMRAYKLFFTVAICSFLGGVVGGWLSAQGVGEAIAGSDKQNIGSYGMLYADEIVAQRVKIVSDALQPVVFMGTNSKGGGMLGLFSAKKPLFDGEGNFNAPMLHLSVAEEGATAIFSDTDLDPRVVIATEGRAPTMDFRYNNVPRLVLGTNHTVTKATGDTHKIKGSVYTFDAKSNVTGCLP